jgi:hypothetical protein
MLKFNPCKLNAVKTADVPTIPSLMTILQNDKTIVGTCEYKPGLDIENILTSVDILVLTNISFAIGQAISKQYATVWAHTENIKIYSPDPAKTRLELATIAELDNQEKYVVIIHKLKEFNTGLINFNVEPVYRCPFITVKNLPNYEPYCVVVAHHTPFKLVKDHDGFHTAIQKISDGYKSPLILTGDFCATPAKVTEVFTKCDIYAPPYPTHLVKNRVSINSMFAVYNTGYYKHKLWTLEQVNKLVPDTEPSVNTLFNLL